MLDNTSIKTIQLNDYNTVLQTPYKVLASFNSFSGILYIGISTAKPEEITAIQQFCLKYCNVNLGVSFLNKLIELNMLYNCYTGEIRPVNID